MTGAGGVARCLPRWRAARLAVPLAAFALMTVGMSGCAIVPASDNSALLAPASPPVELSDVPFYPQTAYDCGPAALAEMLTYSGAPSTPDDLVPATYIPERQGALQTELTARARAAGRLAYPVPPNLSAVAEELREGHPVLVLQNLALSWAPRWHYAVVVGVEPGSGDVILRSGTKRRHRLAAKIFDRTWARAKRWGLVIPPSGELPVSASADRLFHALADLEATASPGAALPYWGAAHKRWPDNGRLSLGLANALYSEGRLEQAARVLRRTAPRVADHQADTLNNLAVVEADLKHWDAAETAARKAITIGGPNAGTYRATLEEIRCRRAGGNDCQSRARDPSRKDH